MLVRMPLIRALAALMLAAAFMSGCATVGQPRPAPDFTATLLSGDKVTLADFKGKPLVIGIGATWCPHCMKEAPIFKRVYDRYDGKIGMMGVLIKSKPEDAEALVRKNKINFLIALDPEEAVAKAFGVHGIPQIYLINKDGIIVDDVFGGIAEDDLIKKIDKMMK